MSARSIALAAALCWSWTAPARADDLVLTGTLRAIADRGSILIGVRDAAVPFSFRNQAGQPVGFSVDLCRGIAEDVAVALHRDLLEPDAPGWQTGVRIAYVPVAADARLPKLVAGEIDIECGSTTATDVRAKTIAFSPAFFLAGTRLLVGGGSTMASYHDIGSVAVSAGTTNEDVLKRLANQTPDAFKIVETSDIPAAYDLLAAGSVDAMASDDILLAGLLATKPDGARFRLVGDFLSFEPYAIGFRRDDPDFAALVRQSFGRMASGGYLAERYRRWFVDTLPNGENLHLPMSAELTEMYRALGQTD